MLTIGEIIFRAVAFIAFMLVIILALNLARRPGRQKHRGKHKKKIKTMDLILVLVGIALLIFTVTMIVLFIKTGSEPSTLETCVFAALAGECGVMGWIKTCKVRYEDRAWQKEDKETPEDQTKPPGEEDFPTNDL